MRNNPSDKPILALINRDLVRTSLFLLLLIATACGDRSGDKNGIRNRLAHASSPYLREHADNPVAWYEWSDEALQTATAKDKPILISIGYASCHWCHVMEEESFMDTAVARVMNENFISIKVDREQRPDVDQIYINAAQLVSGSAGWPLNAFALPDGKPFYAGTYFPKDQWLTLLHQVKDAYAKEREAVIKQAEELTHGIRDYDLIEIPEDSADRIDRKSYDDLFVHWKSQLDFSAGGLAGSPKFPMPVIWEFLLQHYFLTGNKESLGIVMTTLDRMAAGAIYDQIGGGFSRYTTDAEWRVPHFEKMLYDNAQLVSLYAHAYQVTKNPVYRDVIRETLDFVKNEMTGDDGGFFSSLNADSEGEEGKYYTWTQEEFTDAVGDSSASVLMDYFNITDSGNWESGKNILYTETTAERMTSLHNGSFAEWRGILQEARSKLLKVRNTRIRPTTDEKRITSWNALMIVGYLDAFMATSEQDYLSAALKNARFLEKNVIKSGGGLWRMHSENRSEVEAFLDDYACLALAFVRLYQVTLDVDWLEKARSLADHVIENFWDDGTGMFYYASGQTADLVARKMETADQVIPSSNSVMAEVLLLLGEYFQDRSYVSKSTKMLARIGGDRLARSGIFYANWARVSGMSAFEPFQVAVLGGDALKKIRELQQHFNPLVIYLGGDREDLPLLENKLVKGKTIIYVCRNRVCKLPVENISAALQQLKN